MQPASSGRRGFPLGNQNCIWLCNVTDQPGICPGNCLHPELYTLDVSPYESLHVMYYTILRGKGVPLKEKGSAKPVHHPEYDAIYLGFSRNGFDISRPGPDQPLNASGFQLRDGHRRPFHSMTPLQADGVTTAHDHWNFGGVREYNSRLQACGVFFRLELTV